MKRGRKKGYRTPEPRIKPIRVMVSHAEYERIAADAGRKTVARYVRETMLNEGRGK